MAWLRLKSKKIDNTLRCWETEKQEFIYCITLVIFGKTYRENHLVIATASEDEHDQWKTNAAFLRLISILQIYAHMCNKCLFFVGFLLFSIAKIYIVSIIKRDCLD